jgi:hypothetical protein
MKSQSFFLTQFPSAELIDNLKITGKIGRISNTLFISYELLGPIAELVIPAQRKMPGRKNGLWETTCFEFFFIAENADNYWEFNLSPGGNWNVYSFTSYRQGMREEPVIASLPFSIQIHPESLRISLELSLEKIVPVEQSLKAGISAVIKFTDGRVTYWALSHAGPEADFHFRDNFIIDLEGCVTD